MIKFQQDTNVEFIIVEFNRFQLDEFGNIIRYYAEQFIKEEFTVKIDNVEKSSIHFPNKLVTISNRPFRKDRYNMLWDLFHEYGHFLDGEPKYELLIENNLKYRQSRELSAWRNADDEFNKWKDLIPFKNHYELRKTENLQSYGICWQAGE